MLSADDERGLIVAVDLSAFLVRCQKLPTAWQGAVGRNLDDSARNFTVHTLHGRRGVAAWSILVSPRPGNGWGWGVRVEIRGTCILRCPLSGPGARDRIIAGMQFTSSHLSQALLAYEGC